MSEHQIPQYLGLTHMYSDKGQGAALQIQNKNLRKLQLLQYNYINVYAISGILLWSSSI